METSPYTNYMSKEKGVIGNKSEPYTNTLGVSTHLFEE